MELMKVKHLFRVVVLIALSMPVSKFVTAQQQKFTGSWEGKINVGVSLRIVFNFSVKADGTLSATMDSPHLSAFGVAAHTNNILHDSIHTNLDKYKVRFAGKLLNDSLIGGKFSQIIDIPLQLKKVEKVSVLVRPQTPKPPFPYSSKEVTYNNADNSIQFGGTYTKPFIAPNERSRERRYPAILLITGSGQENRDEELFGHKPFAVIADYLTRMGFIVLRVDDRGVGKTTGDVMNATSADFAKDVEAGVNFLKTRIDVDTNRIGLLGHSEGGMIAPMVATKRKDINFIVLLAGPGIPVTDLMTEQAVANLGAAGISAKTQQAYGPLYKSVVKAAITGKDSNAIKKNVTTIVKTWVKKTDPALVKELEMETPAAQQSYINETMRDINKPWFRYFISYNPQPVLQKLTCKVFALNGSKDIQVISKSNLAGIRTSLLKSKSPAYEVMEMPGMNHLFQTCTKCTVAEYGELEETFSPAALEAIGNWLKKNVQ